MPRARLIIAVLGGLFTLFLVPIATNIATSSVPGWLQPYTWLAWPALVALAPITIALVIVENKSDRVSHNITESAIANRHRMLAEVRRVWIKDYLEHSLNNLARMALGLEEKADAVSRPWDLIMQQPNRASRSLPPGQAMGVTFDELGQRLLILGAPGSGKTTLLLELARDLLDRAEQNAKHPIPVVFHLSSWAARRRPLADWLVDELTERYYVPRKLARAWIDAEQVLPLLDGLDEVASEHRAACVTAINTFRRQNELVPLAVCSRAAEYQTLPKRVELSGAVAIEPLRRAQVISYLKQAGKALAGVRRVLRDDETLWELLETPLMLSIVALTYQGRSAAEVRATGSLEQRRRHLFANYTERMFDRRTKVTGYSREQITCWLNWLARSMINNNLGVFYLEWMQPDWLQSRAQRLIVVMTSIMVSGVIGGLLWGLLAGMGGATGMVGSGLEEKLTYAAFGSPPGNGLAFGLVFGLVIGVVGGLIGGLVFWMVGGLDRAEPAEELRWSLRPARSNYRRWIVGGLGSLLAVWPVYLLFTEFATTAKQQLLGQVHGLVSWLVGLLVLGLAVGIVFGLVFGLVSKLEINPAEALRWSWRKARSSCQRGLVYGLLFGVAVVLISRMNEGGPVLVGSVVFGLIFAVLFGLIGGLVGGFTTNQLVTRTSPNEGIRRSLASAVISSLTGGLVLGLLFGLIFALAGAGLFSALGSGLQLGLVIGGLFLALRNGAFSYLKHYVLRFTLWRNGFAPLNYVRFLDYAAERVFLRKVGGGYIFTHRLLMEYFAALQPTDGARQTKTS